MCIFIGGRISGGESFLNQSDFRNNILRKHAINNVGTHNVGTKMNDRHCMMEADLGQFYNTSKCGYRKSLSIRTRTCKNLKRNMLKTLCIQIHCFRLIPWIASE